MRVCACHAPSAAGDDVSHGRGDGGEIETEIETERERGRRKKRNGTGSTDNDINRRKTWRREEGKRERGERRAYIKNCVDQKWITAQTEGNH